MSPPLPTYPPPPAFLLPPPSPLLPPPFSLLPRIYFMMSHVFAFNKQDHSRSLKITYVQATNKYHKVYRPEGIKLLDLTSTTS